MNLHEALGLCPDRPELVCFTGAGGKTTALFRLARELADLGKTVLATTTTAIMHPRADQCDRVVIGPLSDPGNIRPARGARITAAGRSLSAENKLLGFEGNTIDGIFKNGGFDFVLVEGDGSRGRPIKAPAGHEPVVPERTTCLVGLIGLDALGCKINEQTVHRAKEFCAVTRSSPGSPIGPGEAARLVQSSAGLFKNAPAAGRRVLLLNKADTPQRRQTAEEITCRLKNTPLLQRVIVAGLAAGDISIAA